MPPKTKAATPAEPVAQDVTQPADTPTLVVPESSANIVPSGLTEADTAVRAKTYDPLVMDPTVAGFRKVIDQGQNPFEGYAYDDLVVALAAALDELTRLNYVPESGEVEQAPAGDDGDPCAQCFPAGWGAKHIAPAQVSISCGHGTWSRTI